MFLRSFNFTNDIIEFGPRSINVFDFTSNFVAYHSQKQSPGGVLRISFTEFFSKINRKTLAMEPHNSTYFSRTPLLSPSQSLVWKYRSKCYHSQ